MSAPKSAAGMAATIRAGDRRALARAITLIESTRADHQTRAEDLIDALLPHAGGARRLGISGAPGVGKSSFIESFGLALIERGLRPAVLAVDPSSKVSGGSILGDKTRMQALAQHEAAFIRPSPAGKTLGGVARRTREAMIAVEAAGFDPIIVETVGVGQSETAVAELVDMFLLLLQPGGGDELQGIKKGIVELADLFLVTKADGELAPAAERAVAEYRSALHLLRPGPGLWRPEILTCSALTGSGLTEVWDTVERYYQALDPNGGLEAKRAEQARSWLWQELRESLFEALLASPGMAEQVARLEAKVMAGETRPAQASRALLSTFLGTPEGGGPAGHDAG